MKGHGSQGSVMPSVGSWFILFRQRLAKDGAHATRYWRFEEDPTPLNEAGWGNPIEGPRNYKQR
jgi:hypothetical protein